MKKIKIADSEYKKPISFLPDGKPLTLKILNDRVRKLVAIKTEDVISKELVKEIGKLENEIEKLNYIEKKRLVLERYEIIKKKKPQLIQHVLGKGSYTTIENIKEIEADTDIGKELIEIELLFLKRILGKIINGEIDL